MTPRGKFITGAFFAVAVTGAGLSVDGTLDDTAYERVMQGPFEVLLRESLGNAAHKIADAEYQEASRLAALAEDRASVTPENYASHKAMCDELPGALEGALKTAWELNTHINLGVETALSVNQRDERTECTLYKNGEALASFSVQEYIDTEFFASAYIDGITDAFIEKVIPQGGSADLKLREYTAAAVYQAYRNSLP